MNATISVSVTCYERKITTWAFSVRPTYYMLKAAMRLQRSKWFLIPATMELNGTRVSLVSQWIYVLCQKCTGHIINSQGLLLCIHRGEFTSFQAWNPRRCKIIRPSNSLAYHAPHSGEAEWKFFQADSSSFLYFSLLVPLACFTTSCVPLSRWSAKENTVLLRRLLVSVGTPSS